MTTGINIPELREKPTKTSEPPDIHNLNSGILSLSKKFPNLIKQ
jgi:hypothetical protein